jgi:hypothetical protein
MSNNNQQMITLSGQEVFEKYKQWLLDPSKDYIDTCFQSYIGMPYFLSISPKMKQIEEREGDINLIMQFYIDQNEERYNEIKQCLFFNAHNKNIKRIYLFNEREYTKEELGIDNEKIIQYNIKSRLTFENIFNLIEKHSIKGYNVITNSDIFFDSSIRSVRTCDFSTKSIIALCRYEYTGATSLKDSELFGGPHGRPDSQDVWIMHSDVNIEQKHRGIFNFQMGKAGCDNKLLYLMNILGYQCYNEPKLIKTYHNHKTQIRNYNPSDKVIGPYVCVYPNVNEGDNPSQIQSFNMLIENENFCNFIQSKINSNKPFLIPRVAGVENEMAYYGVILRSNPSVFKPNFFVEPCKLMKNNSGIHLTSLESIINYSTQYLEAFHSCDAYLSWELWSDIAKNVFNSFAFVDANFKQTRFWANTMDIYNHINTRLWTRELAGKRLLIISSFAQSFSDKLQIREKIYGVDLFPDCEFIFMKPPQTQGNNESEDFQFELNAFMEAVDTIKDKFDIALVSAGGYGNLICSRLFKMNKSAIYVGGVLQMYFGVYGKRWLRERPDIIRLYANEHWSTPAENERPNGFEKIENSCYW